MSKEYNLEFSMDAMTFSELNHKRRMIKNRITGKTVPVMSLKAQNRRDAFVLTSRLIHSNRIDAKIYPRIVIEFTRIANRKLDDGDNLPSAFKSIRDGVCSAIGIDDGESVFSFRYSQRKRNDCDSIVSSDGVIVRIGFRPHYDWPVFLVPCRERDKFGSGRFGSSRGSRTHRGIDLAVYEGSDVIWTMPNPGKVTRVGLAYANEKYRIVEAVTDIFLNGELKKIMVRFFYCNLHPSLAVGEMVESNNPIAISQDIRSKYPGMVNHIHLEAWTVKENLSRDTLLNPHHIFGALKNGVHR